MHLQAGWSGSLDIAASRKVQQGLEDANASLFDMSKQLEADRAEFTDLTGKIGAAKAQLSELRAVPRLCRA